ncbi:MAG: poly(R)-hydroxyalkanoic acid synthase subunit PhaE [Pseudomonadota bacterium]
MMNAQSAPSNDWFRTQQHYWDAWLEQQRKSFCEQGQMSPCFQGGGPWIDLFKEWQNALSGGQKVPDVTVFQQQFTRAGEMFLNMMQKFSQATGQAKPIDQMMMEWADSLQRFFSGALASNTRPFDASEGQRVFMDTLSRSGQMLSSMLQSGGTGKDPFSACDPLGFFSSMPGVGYSREKQEQLSQLYTQWGEYQRKARAYDAGMSRVGMEAVQHFQDFLVNPPEGQEPLTSLKDVYAKWTDICEDVYAGYAMSDEYVTLYGDVVNTLMAFKKKLYELADDMMEQFNLPTRKEIDSLHERLHTQRRDNLQLRKDIAELKAMFGMRKASAGTATTGKPPKKGKKS